MDNEILTLLKEMKTDITKLTIGQNSMQGEITSIKDDVYSLKVGQDVIGKKLDNALGDLGTLISYDIGNGLSSLRKDISTIIDDELNKIKIVR